MSHKYKVKITSHDYPIGKIKNMVTKYQKEKPQGLMESFGELIKDFKKKGNKKKRKRKGGGGKKSKYNKRRMRKFRITRRKRGGNCNNVKEICASQYKPDSDMYNMCIDFKLEDDMIINLKKKCEGPKKKYQTEEKSHEQVEAAKKKAKKEAEEAYNKCKNDCETKCKRGGKKSKYNIKMARKFRRRTRRKRGRGSFSTVDCADLKQDVAHYKASIAVLDDNNNPVGKYQGMLREIANFVSRHRTGGQRGGAPDTPEARKNRKMLETLRENAEKFKKDNFYKYGLKFDVLPREKRDKFEDEGDVTGVYDYFQTRITEIEASDLYKRLCSTEGGRKSRRRRRRRTKKKKSRRRKKRTRRRRRKKR